MPKATDAGPIDENSIVHLEQAKKGKPRRFVLLCKGPQIVSLVLYKTGSIDKYKKQAKEAGSGQISFGVVEGKGADITFRLARADGFEVEPTRPALMKEFLAKHAEIKCKPAFEIADVLSPLLDPDDPLHARFLKAQAAIPAAAEANPERAADLRSLAGETGQLLDHDRREEAEPKLVALEGILGLTSSTGTPASPVAPPAPPPSAAPVVPTPAPFVSATAQAAPPTTPGISPEVQRLTEAADLLGPRVIAAVKAHPQRRDEILRPVSLFQKQLMDGQSASAQQALDAVIQLLDGLEGKASPASTPALPAAATGVSLVALQKARLDWDTTRKAVRQELKQLEQAILEACSEEPDFAEIKANTKNLYVMLDTLDNRLGDTLDEALNAEPPEVRAAKQTEAVKIAEDYLEYVHDDDLLNDIDDNGITRVRIRTRLMATLHEIINTLLA
jgi:hypothetical protein